MPINFSDLIPKTQKKETPKTLTTLDFSDLIPSKKEEIKTEVKPSILETIKEHPFRSILQPITKTFGGLSPKEKIEEKFISDLSLRAKTPMETFLKTFGLGVIGDIGDILTSPISYVPIPGLKAIGKIPIKGTTVGRIAKTIPVKKGFVKGVERLGQYEQIFKPELQARIPTARPTPLTLIKTPTEIKPIPTRIELETQTQIANQAANIVAQNPESKIAQDTSQRLFRRVAESLGVGDITPEDLPKILQKYNMTPQQFAQMYVDNISTSGKELNILSQLSKKIKQVLPKDPETTRILSKIEDTPETLYEIVSGWYKKVDNVRRASLVSQMATAARNAISQAGRYTLNVFDDALTGVGETIAGKTTPRKAFAPMMEDIFAFTRRLSPKARRDLDNLLSQYPIEEARLINTPIHDAVMSTKYSRMINIFNRGQEYFFRKMAFDAKLNSELTRRGITKEIPETVIGNAVRHALEMTFAETPARGTAGNAWLKLYDKVPFLTALWNPFPRFYANSMKFLWNFSPGGFTRLLAPSFRKQLVSANSREAISALSKATLGTMMLGGGLAIRNSDFGGEKWYEIKTSEGKRIDTRAFAPFSTYLFLAEAISHPERLTNFDWLQGAASINRISGTGLVIVDMVRSGTPEGTVNKLKEFVGQYVGGFTVPLRTLSDIIAQGVPEERMVRTTRESPLIAPAIENIPFLKGILPPSPRVTRPQYYERESPLLRQLTGLTVKTKTPLEIEIDKLGIEYKSLVPRTGDRTLDRLISERMGRATETLGNQMLSNPLYQRLDDDTKKELIKELFSKVKKGAKQVVFPIHILARLNQLKTVEERKEYLKKIFKK